MLILSLDEQTLTKICTCPGGVHSWGQERRSIHVSSSSCAATSWDPLTAQLRPSPLTRRFKSPMAPSFRRPPSVTMSGTWHDKMSIHQLHLSYIRLHKVILDHLGVRSVYVAVGGSMGGMQVLEWPLCTAPGYIKHIIPLATSARHSAWGISWGEAQRKAVYSDPDYDDGWYFRTPGKGPAAGLAAARMSALLTYRSRDSFESRFGRKTQVVVQKNIARQLNQDQNKPSTSSDPSKDESGGNPAYAAHNEGHRSPRVTSPRPTSPRPSFQSQPQVFSAQSYLRYQGDKFTARFDANCYIHITRKMDTHDIARDREDEGDEDEDTSLARVLAQLPPALVISIASDGLFTPFEQKFIAKHILDSELVTIASEDGHDGFLLEFQAIGEAVKRWLRDRAKDSADVEWRDDVAEGEQDYSAKKTSVFGEAEVDVVNW